MATDLNANLSKCIQEVHHIGHTTYHNICTGSATDLAWGAGTWACVSFLTVIVLIIALVFGGLLKTLWSGV